MYPDIALERRQVIAGIKYLPAVSIIIPFQPVITEKDELKYSLISIMQKVEQQLFTRYPAEKAIPVLIKLRNIIINLNYNSHKKSIAIFVSPVVDKVYYLDIEVRENIKVGESFEIKDLLLSKRSTPQYLVMVLNNRSSQMYEGNCSEFKLIKSNISDTTKSTDFLEQMDHGLSLILKAYPLPVVLIGHRSVLGGYKKISENKAVIIQYISISSETTCFDELQGIILPFEAKWQNLKQVYLLNKIDKAHEESKLFFGIENVWDKAMQNKGKILVIEKKYLSPKARIKMHSYRNNDYLSGNEFYIKDEVDEIIEKVLENGGDVEYVDENVLKEYKQIALIE